MINIYIIYNYYIYHNLKFQILKIEYFLKKSFSLEKFSNKVYFIFYRKILTNHNLNYF
jgi:hypothetical protein